MNKIKRNFKKSYIFFAALDVLLVLATVILLILTLTFSGHLAPKVFSHRVYLMDTDAFSLVEKGSAIVADQVKFDEIVPGNIILYTDEKDKTRAGEVQISNAENNVYTYTVKNDADTELTVGQSRILGKGIYYSKALGIIISFVVSPAGVCCLAILPCAAFLIFEIMGTMRRKAPQPTVETVKKQDEIPTYIPEGFSGKKTAVSDTLNDESLAFSDGYESRTEAAGLFSPPVQQKKPEPPKTLVKERKPVLEKDIDKLIKEAKAKHMSDGFAAPNSGDTIRGGAAASGAVGTKGSSAARSAYRQIQAQTDPLNAVGSRSGDVRDPISAVHDISDFSYTAERNQPPRRTEPPKRPSSRVSPRVSRLDSLLQNDNSNSRYDINDILRNIEEK